MLALGSNTHRLHTSSYGESVLEVGLRPAGRGREGDGSRAPIWACDAVVGQLIPWVKPLSSHRRYDLVVGADPAALETEDFS